ncbi:hypothetical protein FACS18949_07940 [Clostridia bacterium]|nr:hypothetical protein FACS18949_07940 [Clostridia bacterium]
MSNFNPIYFPGLGWGPFDPNPTAFSVFGHPIQWYGIIIAVGFLLAAAYGVMRSREVGIKGDDIADALFFCVPLALVGARLYYVVFNWQMFADNPIAALYIWQGGVAIYGGIIFALITAVIVAKHKKINAFALLDIAVIGLCIGQCIGRWGNFINREVYGTVTDLPWRMEIFSWEAGDRIAVHPTFFYESLWTLAGFILLHNLLARRKYDGQVALCYVLWYGLGRGLLEFIRVDNLMFFGTGLQASQLVAFGSAAIAAVLLLYFQLKPVRKPLFVNRVIEKAEEPSEEAAETDKKSAAPVEIDLKYRLKDRDED